MLSARTNYNISDQDVADAKGDAVFLCFDMGMAKAGGYELLSAFELTIIRNFTPCLICATETAKTNLQTHMHTNSHIYIYIYIYAGELI